MGQETLTQLFDGRLHSVAESVQGPGAGSGGLGVPLLQQALRRRVADEAGGVAAQPQHGEVAVGVVGEDPLQVELQVSLAGQRDVVAQHPQQPPVGDDPPQVGGRAVEELLDHPVGRLGRGAGHAGRPPIQRDFCPELMHRHAGAPEVADRVAPVFNGDLAPGELTSGEAQLLQQRAQPAVAGEGGGVAVVGGQRLRFKGCGQVGPQRDQAVPGAADGVGDPLAGHQPVVVRGGAGEVGAAGAQPVEDLAGQQPAPGDDGPAGHAITAARPRPLRRARIGQTALMPAVTAVRPRLLCRARTRRGPRCRGEAAG